MINRDISGERVSDEVIRANTNTQTRLGLKALRPILASDDERWWQSALCAQTGSELFFPEKGDSIQAAKKVCAGCDVRPECLEYAVLNNERFGIWGGLSPNERRRLKRRAV